MEQCTFEKRKIEKCVSSGIAVVVGDDDDDFLWVSFASHQQQIISIIGIGLRYLFLVADAISPYWQTVGAGDKSRQPPL